MRLSHHLRTSHLEEFSFRSINFTRLRHVTPVKELLWVTVALEYDSSSQGVGGRVNAHTGKVSQDLSSSPVSREVMKGCFGCNDIVITILSDLLPFILWDRLIPRQSKLLVMRSCHDKLDLFIVEAFLAKRLLSLITHLYLELLKGLLITRRSKVVNISVAQVVSFTEEQVLVLSLLAIGDLVAQVVDFLIAPAKHSGIENMVIISTIVEANKTCLAELRNIIRRGIDHSHNVLTDASILPVHEK